MTGSDTFLGLLKDNDVRLIAYVPDNVLTPLLKGVSADNYFLSVGATRKDEAGKGQTPRDPTPIRSRFMRGLGTGRSSALEA